MYEKLEKARADLMSPSREYLEIAKPASSSIERFTPQHLRRFGRSTIAATIALAAGALWSAPPVTEAKAPPRFFPVLECPVGCYPKETIVSTPQTLPAETTSTLTTPPKTKSPKINPSILLTSPHTTTTTANIAKAAAFAPIIYKSSNLGVDISWPPSNCTASIPPEVTYGIVGVTGGKAFTSNNCLAQEVKNLKDKGSRLDLYINGDYQSGPAMETYQDQHIPKAKQCAPNDLDCIAYDYGYNAGQYAVQQVVQKSISAGIWWIDVETANSWDGNTKGHNVSENWHSLQGMSEAVEKYASEVTKTPVIVGYYSVPGSMWPQITGGWQPVDARYPGNPNLHAPNWVSKGAGSLAEAQASCQGNDFTGGGTRMVQYQTDPSIDRDVACSSP